VEEVVAVEQPLEAILLLVTMVVDMEEVMVQMVQQEQLQLQERQIPVEVAEVLDPELAIMVLQEVQVSLLFVIQFKFFAI
jgi:hypothetical protein